MWCLKYGSYLIPVAFTEAPSPDTSDSDLTKNTPWTSSESVESVESVANFIDLSGSSWGCTPLTASASPLSDHSMYVRHPWPSSLVTFLSCAWGVGSRAYLRHPRHIDAPIHSHTSVPPPSHSSTRAVLPLPHLMHMQVWKSCRIHSSLRKASWPTHHLHGKQMSAGPSPPRAVRVVGACSQMPDDVCLAWEIPLVFFRPRMQGSVVANVMFEQAVLAFVSPHRAAAQAGGKTPG